MPLEDDEAEVWETDVMLLVTLDPVADADAVLRLVSVVLRLTLPPMVVVDDEDSDGAVSVNTEVAGLEMEVLDAVMDSVTVLVNEEEVLRTVLMTAVPFPEPSVADSDGSVKAPPSLG